MRRRGVRSARGARPPSGAAGTQPGTSTSSTPGGPVAVSTHVVTFIDASRRLKYPRQRPIPRPLVTVIRYPAQRTRTAAADRLRPRVRRHPGDLLPAAARVGTGRLCRRRTGVPAGERARARRPRRVRSGQPARGHELRDHRHARAGGPGRGSFLAGRINPARIGVSGQSDGAETALAMAYDRYFRDPRVRAAAVLSGAEMPNSRAVYFPRASPPLLATQGTADTTNRPHFTYDFFRAAPRPKYLLRLLGAAHLPPYTSQQPQLSIIERVTIAFFDRYLKDDRAAQARMRRGRQRARAGGADRRPLTCRGERPSVQAPVARTVNPDPAGAAVIAPTASRGSEKTRIVASPPNGTCGVTTRPPFCSPTVAFTEAVTPNSVAVPRRVSVPCAEATGTTESSTGSAVRRSDWVTSAGPEQDRTGFRQRRVAQREQARVELRHGRRQVIDVRGFVEQLGQSTGSRAVAAETDRHLVGVMPEQLDGGKRIHRHREDLTRAPETVAQLPGGDAPAAPPERRRAATSTSSEGGEGRGQPTHAASHAGPRHRVGRRLGTRPAARGRRATAWSISPGHRGRARSSGGSSPRRRARAGSWRHRRGRPAARRRPASRPVRSAPASSKRSVRESSESSAAISSLR